jgi:hypothetical protein
MDVGICGHFRCDMQLPEKIDREFDLGCQANLKESSKSKELAELRLQILVVVIANDACESKKEIYET